MTQETQQQEQEVQQQEPIFVTLSLNLEQVNFILNALGKLPTETGAWGLMQRVSQQVHKQLDATSEEENQEKTTTVQ